jgi:hypothetical protein
MEQPYLLLAGALTIVLPLIGFFRSQIAGTKPESILSANDFAIAWMAENTWKARFSLLLLPFVFGYNLLVWAVYGLSSIAEFLAFIVRKLWDFLLLIWQEILYPSAFWLLRLIWHYPLGFLWRFFEFSFGNVRTVVQQQSIIFSIKRLLWLGLSASVLIVLLLLMPNPALLGLGGMLFVLFLIYSMFQVVAYHRADQFSKDKIPGSMLMVFLWLILALAGGLVLFLLYQADGYIVKALGLSVGQIIMPLAALLFIAFLSASTCLPAYYQGKDGMVNTTDYLRQLLKRVPKLLYAQPFQVFGGILVGIIPFAVVFLLHLGAEAVTGKNFFGWSWEVSTMGVHIPNISRNKEEINDLNREIEANRKAIETAKTRFQADEKAKNRQIEDAEGLKSQIQKYKIHTFKGEAYAGETQFFSVPYINNCADYKWIVKKGSKQVAAVSVKAPENGKSVVWYYQWETDGEYTVTLTPSNRCGNSEVIARSVTVLNVPPGKKSIAPPKGKQFVCENEKAVYEAPAGYDTYEWRYPDGTQTTTSRQLKITWGRVSGTVQVRGLKDGQELTLWRGIDVLVEVLPNSADAGQAYLADEENPTFSMERDFIFETREEADAFIAVLDAEKSELKRSYESELSVLQEKIKQLEAGIQALLDANRLERRYLVGKIIAVFGLALAGVLLFSTLFTYLPLYHFDLYTFRDQGKHYWEETLAALRERNPHQPLLGFFLLIPLVFLLVVLYRLVLWYADGMAAPFWVYFVG